MATTTILASVFGSPGHWQETDTWSILRGGAGTALNPNISIVEIQDGVTNKWWNITRSINLFDPSIISNRVVATSAKIRIEGILKKNEIPGNTWKLNCYSSSPASDSVVVAGDYDSLGTTAYCDTPITYTNFSDSGWNEFELNSIGLLALQSAIINGTLFKSGWREAYYDADGNIPTEGSLGGHNSLVFYWQDTAELIITYTYKSYPIDALTRVTGQRIVYKRSPDERQTIYRDELYLGGLTPRTPVEDLIIPPEVTPDLPPKPPSGGRQLTGSYLDKMPTIAELERAKSIMKMIGWL